MAIQICFTCFNQLKTSSKWWIELWPSNRHLTTTNITLLYNKGKPPPEDHVCFVFELLFCIAVYFLIYMIITLQLISCPRGRVRGDQHHSERTWASMWRPATSSRYLPRKNQNQPRSRAVPDRSFTDHPKQ